MNNKELKEKIRNEKLHQWQVADAMGISQYTLCVWLRKPLSPEKETTILNAIQRLKEGERVG